MKRLVHVADRIEECFPRIRKSHVAPAPAHGVTLVHQALKDAVRLLADKEIMEVALARWRRIHGGEHPQDLVLPHLPGERSTWIEMPEVLDVEVPGTTAVLFRRIDPPMVTEGREVGWETVEVYGDPVGGDDADYLRINPNKMLFDTQRKYAGLCPLYPNRTQPSPAEAIRKQTIGMVTRAVYVLDLLEHPAMPIVAEDMGPPSRKNHFSAGKIVPFIEFRRLKIVLPRETILKLGPSGTGHSGWHPRRHSVRASWAHSHKIGDPNCEHIWTVLDDRRRRCSNCGMPSWRVREHKRGDARRGEIVKEYVLAAKSSAGLDR